MEWVGYLSLDRGSAAECCFEFSGSLDSYPKTVYKSSSSPNCLSSHHTLHQSIVAPYSRLARSPLQIHLFPWNCAIHPAPVEFAHARVALTTYRDFGETCGRNDDEEFSIAY